MVRNAASMQSLRDELNHFTIASPSSPPGSAHTHTHSPPEPPLQRLDGSGATMQFCGNDEYTKSLMQKVASGQATDEETAAFNKHINQARSLPSIQNLLQHPQQGMAQVLPAASSDPADPATLLMGLPSDLNERVAGVTAILEQEHREGEQSPELQRKWAEHWSKFPRPPGVPARIKLPEGFKHPAQLDYEQQLKELEAQNKKRLLMARGKQSSTPVEQTRHVLPDYEQQLKELEAHNMRRLLSAQGEQSSTPVDQLQLKQSENSCSGGHALPYYKQQLKELEAQNKRRLLSARRKHPSEPVDQTELKQFQEQCKQKGLDMHVVPDVVPLPADLSDELNQRARRAWDEEQSDCVPGYDRHGRLLTTAKNGPVLWGTEEYRSWEAQQNAPKSKGLAATHAANQEALRFKEASHENAAKYTKPFCKFLTENPTVFHAVDAMKQNLKQKGWTELSERESWDIEPEGHYFVERNGSSLIAFAVGAKYRSGNGAAILAGHVDALTAKVKPISQVPNKAGYLQLGVAPYAGALNSTWWDRDLSIGGRVHVRDGDKIVTKLVKLDWPIARIPTLAPHFGSAAAGPFDKETQMVPIIGLESSDPGSYDTYPEEHGFSLPPLVGSTGGRVRCFVETQPPALVKVIGEELGLNANSYTDIVNWELELFDLQPATVGGINKEFIFAGRIDDKLCSWAALQALIESQENDTAHSGIIKVVGLFDDEEIGSLLRQGAKGNFLPSTMERAVGSLAGHHPNSDLMGRTYANSFMVSSDVTHAVNPNFLGAYLENHAPHLNVGIAIAADSNGHMTTDSVSTTILKRCADKVGAKLQVFQIRNGTPSGGTVGPMLSSAIGVRSIDAGLAQLSMHSIRATTGALDPGLGVLMFAGFLNGFEGVDKEFQG